MNGTAIANIHSVVRRLRKSNLDNYLDKKETKTMLWTIFIILLVLWALGFGVAGAALGNLIHILLVVAVIVLIVQLVSGRRAL